MHEQRRDLLADAIIHVAVILHWFNPAVWLAARMARHDCELACDEQVLDALPLSDRNSYGSTLVRIASLANISAPARVSLGAVQFKQQLRHRIQMIIANRSRSRIRTLLGIVLFFCLIGASLTRGISAQAPTTTLNPVAPGTQPDVARNDPGSFIAYDPSVDRLDVLFPNGIVATVGDRNITVGDVRGYIAPLIPRLRLDAHNQEEFNGRLFVLQNSAIKDLVSRAVLIRQFHDQKEGEQPKQIANEYIDTYIADMVKGRFDGDRTRFLA